MAENGGRKKTMADRLISADALQKIFNEVTSGLLAKPELSKDAEHIVRACLMVTKMIQDAPTVEAEPIKHGRWKGMNKNKYNDDEATCSICGVTFASGYSNPYWWDYCPNCGAKMDEEESEG